MDAGGERRRLPVAGAIVSLHRRLPDEVLSRSAVGVQPGVCTWPVAEQSGMSGQRERGVVGSSTGQGVRLGPALGTPTPGLTFSGCFL